MLEREEWKRVGVAVFEEKEKIKEDVLRRPVHLFKQYSVLFPRAAMMEL